ncbi:MAG: UDP-N-acetylmuramate--L-alanine ligase [Acidobacteria bacterium]|nr:MAG: UDP-N-acetylmuramate--L-alanine ligase [Acidobacteriota bacterium]
MLGRTRRIHLVGAGGSGMSGIAELLVNLGYSVSGSDLQQTQVTDRLASLGVQMYHGHAAEHVGDADVVVMSSAVRSTNPEVIEAERRRIPVIPRAEMLAEFMRLRSGIAIAGAHGKTTTTSMIALALERAGLDPTAVIGGRLSTFGSNARLGQGQWMVAEADESDRSFLKLSPTLAVVTNIDHEHIEAYRSFDDLQQAFVDFANKVPFYGAVVICVNDPTLRDIRPRLTRRVVTYGLETEAEFAGVDVVLDGLRASCTVRRRSVDARTDRTSDLVIGNLRLTVPGRHNLQNALAAIAVTTELAIPFETAAKALEEFKGVERRFQVLGEARGVTVVDDYGHHPTEIAAVMTAARAQHPARLLVIFQPHRYTRTQQQLAHFGAALAGADEVLLTDIYSAGEDAIPGVTVEALAEAMRTGGQPNVKVIQSLSDIPALVAATAKPGDLVLMLGAGSIGAWGPKVLDVLAGARE